MWHQFTERTKYTGQGYVVLNKKYVRKGCCYKQNITLWNKIQILKFQGVKSKEHFKGIVFTLALFLFSNIQN